MKATKIKQVLAIFMALTLSAGFLSCSKDDDGASESYGVGTQKEGSAPASQSEEVIPIEEGDVIKKNSIWYKVNPSLTDVTVIYRGEGNEYLGDIVIPSSISYGGREFAVTAIGQKAFYESQEVTSVSIPESVTTIGSSAFYRCSSLTSIDLPSNLKEISSMTFLSCSNLTSITIPANVTKIGSMVFAYCDMLKSIVCHIKHPAACALDESWMFESRDLRKRTTLYVPVASFAEYTAAPGWSDFENIRTF